ncbi:MAG: enoyl-CoA hydratase-related protein [Solirubrobacterales bacterium]
MGDGVRTEVIGGVGVCRIDQPDTRNALSPVLLAAVIDGLEELDGDPTVRCIVLAGTDEVFATGADARSLAAGTPEADANQGQADFWSRLSAVGAPVVAGVSGWALGTGCELALACDLIVASKTTRFGQPEVTLGLIPGGGATQRLTRALGKQRAMELILTGRRMGAEQAHSYGLVNVVADRKKWFEATMSLATQISERAPVATRLAKRAILAADRENLDEGLTTERRLLADAMATEDHVEGVKAFLEGRPPRFEGH